MALMDCVRCGAGRPRVECCVQCEQPKWPQRARGSNAEVEHDWPACVNPNCESYGVPMASATFLPGAEVKWSEPKACDGFQPALGESGAGADADCARCGNPRWLHGLDAIADTVLAYRPKARSKPAVQRKRRRTILEKKRAKEK